MGSAGMVVPRPEVNLAHRRIIKHRIHTFPPIIKTYESIAVLIIVHHAFIELLLISYKRMKPLINSPFAPYMFKNLSAMLNLLSFSELPQVFFVEIFDKVAHFIAIVHLKIFHIKII